MPTPAENLFLLLKEKKYEEINKVIDSDDSLINAVNPENGRSLFQSVSPFKGKEIDDLILSLLQHPKFNFIYENAKSSITNIDVLVSSNHVEVVKRIIGNDALLFNKSELSYSKAKKHLDLVKETLD